jgi:hypothetical protein
MSLMTNFGPACRKVSQAIVEAEFIPLPES